MCSRQWAVSHLTRRLFGQILRHIERLTWHPARRLTPSVGRPLDQVGGNPGGSVSEGGTQGWRLGGGAIPKRTPVIDSAWAARQVGERAARLAAPEEGEMAPYRESR